VFAVALALAASCCWGTSDFIGGLQTRRLGIVPVMTAVTALPLVAIVVLLIATAPPVPGGQAIVASVLAGLVGLVGLSVLYRALALGPMSLVAPISATGAIVPVVVGLATGDHPRALQGVGLAVTIGGVVLAARQRSEPGAAGAGERRGIVLAVIAALGIGCFLLGAHEGSRGGVLWFVLLSRAAAVLPLAVAVGIAGRGALPRPGQLPPLILVSALDGGATALLSLANRHGVVSIVSVVASLYPVVTLLLARGVLGERMSPPQAAGVAGALAGVALVSAG